MMAQDAPQAAASDSYTEASMHRAIEYYRRELREILERDFVNQYVRLDADTGQYAIGPTRQAARTAFATQFGALRGWTMHIGLT
jgi:hypothetical protein